MEIEVAGFVPELFHNEQQVSEGDHDLPRCCSTLTASQEYAILDEFPELNVMNLSDYAEIDSVYRYDPFDAVDTEAAIVGIITAEYMRFEMPTHSLKRAAAELDSIDVEKVNTKPPRRRSEDGRLANFGWKKEDNGQSGKRPRFVYTSPTGDQLTSMKKAMATIRLTASTKGAAAKFEQSV
jgi:hypothetical protein